MSVTRPCALCDWPNSRVVNTLPPHTAETCRALVMCNELDVAGFIRAPARAITGARALGPNFDDCVAVVYLPKRRPSNRPSHDAYTSWHIVIDPRVADFISYVFTATSGTAEIIPKLRTHDVREILLPLLRFTDDPRSAMLALADRLPHAKPFAEVVIPDDRIWWPAAAHGRAKSKWRATRLAAWLQVQPQHVDTATRFKIDIARTWAAAYQSGYAGESVKSVATPESAMHMMSALPWPYRVLTSPKDLKERPGYRLLHDESFDPASWTPYGSRADEVRRRKKRCNGRKSSVERTSTNS